MLRFIEITDSPEPFVFDYPGTDWADAEALAKNDPTPLGQFVHKLFSDKNIRLRFKTHVIAD